MVTTASIAHVAALIGDPTRASMLQALMDGRALTATELAGVARVAPQTASGHLSQLTTAGLVMVARQGRHRYHRLATPLVARMLESVMLVAASTAAPPNPTGARGERPPPPPPPHHPNPRRFWGGGVCGLGGGRGVEGDEGG